MKKIVLTCGIIAGLISAAWCAISVRVMPDDVTLDTRTWLGYTSMILSFSLIFVGIKQYRDNLNGGYITFGKAFKVGLYIALIGSTLYVLLWLISYYFFFPDFMQKYNHLMLLQMQADGKTAADIQKEMADMAKFGEWYKNPVFNILITYSEILPVGLVVSLIAAAILRKKRYEAVDVAA
jgi:ethanolamine transporter EutH